MTLAAGLIWGGTALTVLGLIGLGYCIIRVLAIRQEANSETAAEQMRAMVVLNVASVGIASMGLAAVIVGIIL